MRRFLACLSLAAALAFSAPALAADAPAKDGSKADINLPAMSPDKTIQQVVRVGNRALRYTATVGHIDVRDAKGKTIGQIVYTAYAVAGPGNRSAGNLRLQRRPRRQPLYSSTWARSVPRKSVSECRATARRTRPFCTTIPRHWLDFTDLVFA